MQYADVFGLFFHTWGRPPCSESIMEQTTIAYLERRYAIVRVPAIHLELFSRSSSALPRRSKACFFPKLPPPFRQIGSRHKAIGHRAQLLQHKVVWLVGDGGHFDTLTG